MLKYIFDLANKIVDKVLSARFLITLAVGMTYCHIVWHAVHFYLKSMVGDSKQMDAFATGLIMGFTGIASFIFKAYFDRADRAAEVNSTSAAVASEAPKTPVDNKNVLPVLLICCGLLFATGCNTIKSGCGHLTGSEVTIPYVGGKANGNAYGCYIGCFGLSCPKLTGDQLTTITTEYIKDASKDNAMTISGPGTITYTPAK